MLLRVLAMGGALSGLLLGADGVHAQELDGPAPVNSSASLSAGADEDLTVRSRNEPLERTAQPGHPLGSYAGVVPGAGTQPPAATAANGDGRPIVTWPGFQMRPDGTSRVFIQSTIQLTPQPSAAPGKFTLQLPGAKVAAGTNRLPLETRFFNTPVTRVNIAVQRDAVTISLDLRADVSPVLSSERGPSGFYFIYVDLPKGQYLRGEPSALEAPPAPPAPGDRARYLDTDPSSSGEMRASASGEVGSKAELDASKAKASAKLGGKATIKLGR